MAAGVMNDDIVNATEILSPTSSQNTSNAGTAPGEDIVADTAADVSNTVWFKYTAATTGPVEINSLGSNFDTTLQAYALTDPSAPVSYANLTQLDENDDVSPDAGAAARTSVIRFDAVAGQTYYIQAGGTSSGGLSPSGDLVINASPVCFVSGTHIKTARGEIAVEHLQVGDLAVTASGEHRSIRWIGHRKLNCRRHPKPHEVHPVRILKNAFGLGKPERDLFVSPGHAVCLDLLGEVLIPASSVVNGATIAQVEVDEVTYWHVELDGHDILIADGLPAESYLEMGNRAFFAAANGDAAAAPDTPVPTHADFCRPFLCNGKVVEAARERLRARAIDMGWSLKPDRFAGLHIVADGQVVQPTLNGHVARFLLPAGCEDVRLISGASVPAQVDDSGDGRQLGVDLQRVTINDGLSVQRDIDLGDARLRDGFYDLEGKDADQHRWTNGRAVLPRTLWEDCQGEFFLRLELGGGSLLRWQEPPSGSAANSGEPAASDPRLRLVAVAA
ncbi:Hint domain-containing protein [Methylobacterium sp. ID0610]|uniref:Hint domain-containing protein n=1 Tax=Methylobacterium carpenticola TaxID=3344827 RepID=UPI0036ABADA3